MWLCLVLSCREMRRLLLLEVLRLRSLHLTLYLGSLFT